MDTKTKAGYNPSKEESDEFEAESLFVYTPTAELNQAKLQPSDNLPGYGSSPGGTSMLRVFSSKQNLWVEHSMG